MTTPPNENWDLWTMARVVTSSLVLMLAAYYLLVAFDNITQPASNWAYVKGVMTLDGVPPDSGFAWRAIDNTVIQAIAYGSIIILETVAGVALAIGGVNGMRRRCNPVVWAASERIVIAGLLVALTVFLLGFVVIGGNWWMMYLNKKWNGLQPAFQNSALALLTLVIVLGVAAISTAESRDGGGGGDGDEQLP